MIVLFFTYSLIFEKIVNYIFFHGTTPECTTVQQNWTEVFNDTFYPPCGGTYVIQSSNEPSKKYVIPGKNDPC